MIEDNIKRRITMPVLSRFYGIIIRMYFLQSEHNPPHIHAIYNEDVAAIDFMTGEVLEGHLPSKAMNMVQEWISIKVSLCIEIHSSTIFIALFGRYPSSTSPVIKSIAATSSL